ncbi:MAG: signal recognition particle-docking protein FtsY [Gammaproteobacteria bacterium]
MMPTHAHERAAFERFFVPGAAPMRGPEVLSEQALFARYFGAEAANQPVAPVVAKAIPTPVVAPVAPPAQAPAAVKPVAPPAAKAEVVEVPVSFFARVKQGLSRTRSGLTDGLASLLLGKKAIDDGLLEDIETQLLTADVGVEATRKILDAITARLKRKELADSDALYKALQEEMAAILTRADGGGGFHIDTSKKPYVILMVGVNGVGKTTTIGKLAKKLQQEGKSVMLAAGDTFRAAAVEQLQVWGERNNIQVVAQHTGADSASVIFDALQSARSRGVDVLIADTAGRLHTKSNLMDELAKVKRVMGKIDPSAPHEVMLVLDAGTGQNALNQAVQFHEAVGVTGLTLTKLDGTAKGGIVFAIAAKMQLPIRFIGVGEKIDDLRPFEADGFVKALFDR